MEPSEPTTIAVPDGHVADVITHLEMLERPLVELSASTLTIAEWSNPAAKDYLELFRAVGEPWLWLSRLLLSEKELTDILQHPKNMLFRIEDNDLPIGILELNFRQTDECEIGFFGLVPTYNGKGHGKWLMAQTLDRAWQSDIKRVWLHTCTLDSPFALGFYQKCGFKAFKRELSMGRDPRLLGLLPETAGPHIPLIR